MVSMFLVEDPHRNPADTTLEASAGAPNNPEEPLSIPLADFTRDLHVSTTSAFVAAQQAALSFERLPDHRSKTFIYTGNILNETIIAGLLDGGVGKSATAHIIRSAAAAYSNKGFKYAFSFFRLSGFEINEKADSIMPMSGRPTGLLHTLRSVVRHMEISMPSSPSTSLRVLGSRRL
jgi:hypothetical protein